jgi:Polyketide cyclase / dehydrase and lipid transport
LGDEGGSGVRLAASQVIERPPAEVFRFVATDHFQNHPKWDPAVTSITQTSPGPMGAGTTARLVRTDRGRRVEGTMEVTEYQPVSSFTEVSRFGPFTLHARARLAAVAPASTRLELVIDTRARGVIRLLLPLMRGTFRKTMARSLRSIKEQVEATAPPTT